jgi:hypothetical protein
MSEINTTDLGLQAQIYTDVETMPDRIKFRDRSNVGKALALLMMWKKVEQLAAKKYETLLKKQIEEGAITDPQSITVPGNHMLGGNNKIMIQANVSVPRREFNVDWLAARMEKDYKVPQAMTRQLVEEAKRPGSTQVRRVTVVERGGD